MGDDEEVCNTRLQLGLGLGDQSYAPRQERKNKERPNLVCLDLSFALFPKEEVAANNLEDDHHHHMANGSTAKTLIDKDNKEYTNDRRSSDHTKNKSMMKTHKNGARKKLRLTKEQSTLLEDRFKRHSTLNLAQKQALAEQLNLNPRQVEVWFQNRRARTKLKQTEVDCEFLKKCCESLSDENQRLKKELQELKSSPALCNNFQTIPKSTMLLTMCSACEKMVEVNNHHKEEAAKK